MEKESIFNLPCVGDRFKDGGDSVVVAGVFWSPSTFRGKPVVFVAPIKKLGLYFRHIKSMAAFSLLDCAESLGELAKTDKDFSFINLLAERNGLREENPAATVPKKKRDVLMGSLTPGAEIDYGGRLHAVEGHLLAGARSSPAVHIILREVHPTHYDPPCSIVDLDALATPRLIKRVFSAPLMAPAPMF